MSNVGPFQLPGNPLILKDNSGETWLARIGGVFFISTDGGVTWAAAGGGFAADTLIQLPDSGAVQKNAWHSQITLTNPGLGLLSVSQWTLKFLKSGIGETLSYTFTADTLTMASLISQIWLGPDNFLARTGNGSLNLVTNANIVVDTIGGGALLVGATKGVLELTSCPGVPTGTLSPLTTGHAGEIFDSADLRPFYSFGAGLWAAAGDNFKLGAVLTDANLTRGRSNGSEFVLPAGVLTANRTLTIDTTGSPFTNQTIRVTRFDSSANTYAIINGGGGAGTKLTMPASTRMAADFKFDGTNWGLDRVWDMN